MCNFDVFQSNDHEGRLGELDETVRSRLAEDIAAERDTIKAQITLRHIDFNALVLAGICNLLRKALEVTVQLCSPPTFLLLGFELIFVTIAILPLAIASLVELDVGCFPVELNILGLLLVAHDDGIFEMYVDDDNELMLARLEEEVFDVGEKDVGPLVRTKRGLVPDTILVDLNLSRHSLALHGGANEDIVKHRRASV